MHRGKGWRTARLVTMVTLHRPPQPSEPGLFRRGSSPLPLAPASGGDGGSEGTEGVRKGGDGNRRPSGTVTIGASPFHAAREAMRAFLRGERKEFFFRWTSLAKFSSKTRNVTRSFYKMSFPGQFIDFSIFCGNLNIILCNFEGTPLSDYIYNFKIYIYIYTEETIITSELVEHTNNDKSHESSSLQN